MLTGVQAHTAHCRSVSYYYYGCYNAAFSKKMTYNKYFSSWGTTTIIPIKLIAFYPKSGYLKVLMIVCSFICTTLMGPGNPSSEPLGLLWKFLYFLENVWTHSHWDHLKSCSHSIINVVLMIKKKKKRWMDAPNSGYFLEPGLQRAPPLHLLCGWPQAFALNYPKLCPWSRLAGTWPNTHPVLSAQNVGFQRRYKETADKGQWAQPLEERSMIMPCSRQSTHPGILATNFPF